MKRLIVNFIKVKIIISSETLERLQNIPSFRFILAERVEVVFPPSANFPDVGCIRNVVVSGKLKEDNKFNCQTWVNQQTNIA